MDIQKAINSYPRIALFLIAFGLIKISSISKTILCEFYKIFASFRNSPYKRYYNLDTYAVVTGASDGIGKGFCEELAKLNFNICLVGRNLVKLQNVEKN